MASGVDTSKVQRAFRRAAKDPVVAELAVAVYQKALRDGLAQRLLNTSVPNAEGWRERKRQKGWDQRPMVRTGRLLAAVQNNPPSKVGTRRRMRLGVNWRRAVAFVMPRAFTNHKGRALAAKVQDKVYRVHRYGSAVSKIAASWEKLRGERGVRAAYRRALHGSFEGYLAAAAGPSRASREAAARGSRGTPARPVFAWDRSWEAEMSRDVEAAVVRLLGKEGFDVRG